MDFITKSIKGVLSGDTEALVALLIAVVVAQGILLWKSWWKDYKSLETGVAGIKLNCIKEGRISVQLASSVAKLIIEVESVGEGIKAVRVDAKENAVANSIEHRVISDTQKEQGERISKIEGGMRRAREDDRG